MACPSLLYYTWRTARGYWRRWTALLPLGLLRNLGLAATIDILLQYLIASSCFEVPAAALGPLLASPSSGDCILLRCRHPLGCLVELMGFSEVLTT